jgi:hypothetical protein
LEELGSPETGGGSGSLGFKESIGEREEIICNAARANSIEGKEVMRKQGNVVLTGGDVGQEVAARLGGDPA